MLKIEMIMMLSLLFTAAVALQPPPVTNFDTAAQCAATLKVATEGLSGPNAEEAARIGREYHRAAEEIGRSLSRDAEGRIRDYEGVLKATRSSNPALFNQGLDYCRIEGAKHFPTPAP